MVLSAPTHLVKERKLSDDGVFPPAVNDVVVDGKAVAQIRTDAFAHTWVQNSLGKWRMVSSVLRHVEVFGLDSVTLDETMVFDVPGDGQEPVGDGWPELWSCKPRNHDAGIDWAASN